MKKVYSFLVLIIASFLPQLMSAQSQMGPDSYKGEDSNKMFVVFLVISVIFIGLMIFMFILERKIKKLEQTSEIIEKETNE